MRPTIIAYHAIADCPREDDPHNLFIAPDTFRSQMAYLARERRVIPLREVFVSRTYDRPAVAITFDDAYRNVSTNALPILEEHGFEATVFAPVGHLGSRNDWDEPSACPLEIMSAEELVDCDARGLRVESHGYRHVDHTTLSEEESGRDVHASIDALTKIVGRAPRYFAYPYGRAPRRPDGWFASLGIDAAFTIDRPSTDPQAFERVQITPRDGRLVFTLKTSGRYLGLRWSRPVRLALTASGSLRQARRRSHTS